MAISAEELAAEERVLIDQITQLSGRIGQIEALAGQMVPGVVIKDPELREGD